MPYGYNRYNQPGFAEGFRDTHDLLQQLRAEEGLAAIEKSQAQDVTQQAAPVTIQGLSDADAGQNDSAAYGRYDRDAGLASGQAVGDVTLAPPPAPKQMRIGDQTYAGDANDPGAVANAKAQARASMYRRYGMGDEANKEASSDLQQQQARQNLAGGAITQELNRYRLKTAQREEQSAAGVQQAEEDTRDYIRMNNVDPTTPSGAADIAAHHIAALTKAGRTTEAMKASTDFSKQIKAQIDATDGQRLEAAKSVQQALQTGGDLTQPLRALDQFLPNGGQVKSVAKNADGTFTISRIESNGQPNQMRASPQQISQMLDMVTGSDYTKVANQMVLQRLQIQAEQALIAQRGQSMSNSRADAEEKAYDFERKKSLNSAYDTPEDQRTPEQKQRIQGYSDHIDDSRPARSGNQGGSIKINPDGSQTYLDRSDGTVWEKARGTQVWNDVTPGRAASARKDPTTMGAGGASPSGAGGGNLPPAPRDPQQRVAGKTYLSPATGKPVKWTGTGWESAD